MDTMHWTLRRIGNRGPWRLEDGWRSPEQAERSAKHYRQHYHQPCIVVPVAAGQDETDAALAALNTR